MSVYKRGTHWHYRFRLRGVRYRGALPEARTKFQAEQAEIRLKQNVFEGKFGRLETGTMKGSDFIDEIYMPWAESNKKSWKNDKYSKEVLKKFFGNKQLREIQPLEIEKFKTKRLATKTKHDTERAPASVNREFEMLSRIFTLAISLGKADFNPCSHVEKFQLDNERYRYLEPEEESTLMSKLIDTRRHLVDMVILALGLGLRKREQLNLRRDQVDIFPQSSNRQQNQRQAEPRNTNGCPRRARQTNSNEALRKQESRRISAYKSKDGKALHRHQELLRYRMPTRRNTESRVARSTGHFLHSAGNGRLRRFYNQDHHGAPRYENYREIHSGS